MPTSSTDFGRSNRARLNCEQLESRSNPSNVKAVLTSSNYLVVTGDNTDNTIIVQDNPQGNYFVVGVNGTFVNGNMNGLISGVGFGAIHPYGIVIYDGNGNDKIEVLGVHATQGFLVAPGNGNDSINLSGVVANYVLVNAQGGNDTLETSSVVAHVGASIVAGSGMNVWYDNSLSAGSYIQQSGWSEILT